jgi:hypothetical protein
LRTGASPALSFAFGTAGGLAFGVGASLIEYLRLLYQDWALGKVEVEATDPGLMKDGIRERVGMLGPFFDLWYGGYSNQQRLLLPVTASLEARVQALREEDAKGFARFREIYAREQYPMLRRWWPMAPNTHKLVIVSCAFVPAFDGGLVAGFGVYWTFVLNLALVPVGAWLMRAQSRRDRGFLEQIERIAGA